MKKKTLQFRDSPVIVYRYPRTRDDGLCAPGRLAYLERKPFLNLGRNIVLSSGRIKRHFWYCKDWVRMGPDLHG